MEAWCSGLTCSPVKAEIAGSNPVASARFTCQACSWHTNAWLRAEGVMLSARLLLQACAGDVGRSGRCRRACRRLRERPALSVTPTAMLRSAQGTPTCVATGRSLPLSVAQRSSGRTRVRQRLSLTGRAAGPRLVALEDAFDGVEQLAEGVHRGAPFRHQRVDHRAASGGTVAQVREVVGATTASTETVHRARRQWRQSGRRRRRARRGRAPSCRPTVRRRRSSAR
jgi:hypothetical protein